MFNIDNEKYITSMVDMREDNQYVIPLYVKMYKERYSLDELNQITDFSPSGFKVGFGSNINPFSSNSFITEFILDFDVVRTCTGENNLSGKYIVFESGYVNNDTLMHDQINSYVQLLESHIKDNISKIKQNIAESDNH